MLPFSSTARIATCANVFAGNESVCGDPAAPGAGGAGLVIGNAPFQFAAVIGLSDSRTS